MSYAGYEYGNDDFGGDGGGGWNQGGGFLGNDQVGASQGGYQGGSPGAKVYSRDRQTILPLTLRQVLGANMRDGDDMYRIDGVDLHQIQVVGQIIEVEETATQCLYTLDDGTARTTVKMPADSGASLFKQEQRALCQKGVYVRVVGQLRDWQGRASFNVFDIRMIKDSNEITLHLLEAIFAHCYNTKGGRVGKPKSGGMMQAGFGANYGAPLGNHGGFGGDVGGDFTPLQNAVLAAFRDGVGDQGEDISNVIRRLSAQGHTAQAVRDAVEFLSSEGHLYTTSDETHYRATS